MSALARRESERNNDLDDTSSLLQSRPDGYGLYVGYTSETVIVPQVSHAIKYSIDDFEPIAVTGVCS